MAGKRAVRVVVVVACVVIGAGSTAVDRGQTASAGNDPAGVPLAPPVQCAELIDYAGELQPTGFEVLAQTPADDGTVQVELGARMLNTGPATFGSASAEPDLGGLPFDAEVVRPFGFAALDPLGEAGTVASLAVRVPAEQATALVEAITTGAAPMSVHADELTVLRDGVHLFTWSDAEDALTDPSGTPVWVDEPPFGLSQIPEGERLFVLYDPADPPEHIDPSLWTVEITEIAWDADAERWAVTFAPWTQTADSSTVLGELIHTGAGCTDVAIDDPVQVTQLSSIDNQPTMPGESMFNHQPVRFNDVLFADGAIALSGQIAGHILHPTFTLRFRDGQLIVGAGIETDVSLSLQLEARADAELVDSETELFNLCFPMPPLRLGPVDLSTGLHVRHLVGVEGSAKAGLVTGIQQAANAGIELRYDPSQTPALDVVPFADVAPTQITPPVVTDDTALDLRAYGALAFSIEVGDGCGLDLIDAEIGMRLDVDGSLHVAPTEDPWWRVGYGAELSADASFNLLGLEIAEHTWPITRFDGPSERTSTSAGGAVATSAAPASGRTSGDDTRWMLSVDDLNTRFSIEKAGVAAAPDGGVYLGSPSSVLSSFDRYGALNWSRRLGPGNQPTWLAVGGAGDPLAVAGDAGNGRPFLGLVETSTGDAVWGKSYAMRMPGYSANAVCTPRDMKSFVDEDGERGYIIVGLHGYTDVFGDDAACALRLDSTGEVVWARVYDVIDGTGSSVAEPDVFDAVAPLPEGGFAVVGGAGLHDPANRRLLMVARLDADGHLAWAKGAEAYYRGLHGYDVVVDGDTWYLVGNAQGIVTQSASLLVGKIDGDGTDLQIALVAQDEAWERIAGTYEPWLDTDGGNTQYDIAYSLAAVPGGFVVVGRTGGSPRGAWVFKMNDRLGIEWFETIDGESNDELFAVATGTDGIFVTGNTASRTPSGYPEQLLAHLPFEGMVGLRDDAPLVVHYIEPGVRAGLAPDGHLLTGSNAITQPLDWYDIPLVEHTAEVVVEVTVIPALTGATGQVCVTLLSETGRPSWNDSCQSAEELDADGDGVEDDTDNCPTTPNPDQADLDNDGTGDTCDPDTDGDTIDNDTDNCPLEPEDLDGDADDDGCPDAAPAPPDPCSTAPTITGTSRSDMLVGTPGVDVIHARGGNDVIIALGGDDLVCAGAGRDLVLAGDGDDAVDAGNGNDTVDGGRGFDRCRPGRGRDTVRRCEQLER